MTVRAIIDATDGINDHSRKINTIIGCEILHIGVIKRFYKLQHLTITTDVFTAITFVKSLHSSSVNIV